MSTDCQKSAIIVKKNLRTKSSCILTMLSLILQFFYLTCFKKTHDQMKNFHSLDVLPIFYEGNKVTAKIKQKWLFGYFLEYYLVETFLLLLCEQKLRKNSVRRSRFRKGFLITLSGEKQNTLIQPLALPLSWNEQNVCLFNYLVAACLLINDVTQFAGSSFCCRQCRMHEQFYRRFSDGCSLRR